MKQLFAFLLAAISLNAFAFGDGIKPPSKGQCVNSIIFHYEITEQLEPGIYGLQGDDHASPQAIWISKSKPYGSTGAIVANLRFIKTKMVPVNGFDTPVDFWEDCSE